MFGYIKPSEPYLYKKDDVLYNAIYCGTCKSIGKCLGQRARFTLTYDIALLSLVAHNILGVDIKINKECCVAHPFKKRPIAQNDEIFEFCAKTNTILAKYKIIDDSIDKDKKTFGSFFVNKGYKKAKKDLPKIDEIVNNAYQTLRELENKKSNQIDGVSNSFGEMLKGISCEILGDKRTEFTDDLFYQVGKWIYIIDAVDDYDKDKKKDSYNVFRYKYNSQGKKSLINDNIKDLDFLFIGIFNSIKNDLNNIKFYFNSDLIYNILTRGILEVTESILECKDDKR